MRTYLQHLHYKNILQNQLRNLGGKKGRVWICWFWGWGGGIAAAMLISSASIRLCLSLTTPVTDRLHHARAGSLLNQASFGKQKHHPIKVGGVQAFVVDVQTPPPLLPPQTHPSLLNAQRCWSAMEFSDSWTIIEITGGIPRLLYNPNDVYFFCWCVDTSITNHFTSKAQSHVNAVTLKQLYQFVLCLLDFFSQLICDIKPLNFYLSAYLTI